MRGLWLTLLVLVSGCLAPAAEIETASIGGALVVEGEPAAEGLARWNGSTLSHSFQRAALAQMYACWADAPVCDDALVECTDANCERRAFEIAGEVGAVTLSVRWPISNALFDAWIEDASGAVVAVAPHRLPGMAGLVARLEAPAPGAYTAVVAIRQFESDYQAAIRLDPAPEEGEARALLPNLVTLAPTDLTLETPNFIGTAIIGYPVPFLADAMEATGHKGCRADEAAEYGHKRCLRFSNSVANTGEGPLDVSLTAGSMEFLQYVHRTDGTVEEHPGGAAEWHASHAHWHNAASNAFTLHPYDPATRAIGEPTGHGQKGGICFGDVGLVDVGQPGAMPAAEHAWWCFGPRPETTEWHMGITVGWYDLYPYLLPEQYIDITGLEDGTYTLCSVTNAEGTLLESDASDNLACTPFRLTGDEIELLEPAPYHAMPDDD